MTIQDFITTNLELCDRATEGPGFTGHCPVNSETLPKIKEAFLSSLEKSIEHDPDQEFWWIETNEKLTIGYFGNGPTSESNATLWAASRLALPRALKALEVALYRLEECSKASVLGKIYNDIGIAEIEKILGGGENVKP